MTLIVLCAACGSGPDGDGDDDDDDDDDDDIAAVDGAAGDGAGGDGAIALDAAASDDGAIGIDAAPVDATCTTLAFATSPTHFALPAGYGMRAFNQWTGSSPVCPVNTPAHDIADLDGDGRRDLVITEHCSLSEVGTTTWLFHRGGSNGFEAPTELALPSGYPDGSFSRLEQGWTCIDATRPPSYVSLDLVGDGWLDLVITTSCVDALVGESYWLVHEGSPTGFSQTPVEYGLPSDGWWPRADIDLNYPGAAIRLVTLDLDGDGPLDLVVYQDLLQPTIGYDHWRYHRGGPTGFAEEATSFALVPPFVDDYPTRFGGARVDREVFDFIAVAEDLSEGRGYPDLYLHRNVGDGFALEGEVFDVPYGQYPPMTFSTGLGGLGACNAPSDNVSSLFVDIDGDTRRDLVIVRRCLGGVDEEILGYSHWLVHRGIPGGVATAAQVMPLPTPVAANWSLNPNVPVFDRNAGHPYQAPANSYDCNGVACTILMDVVGSPADDLVVTAIAADSSVGTDHWDVYENLADCP